MLAKYKAINPIPVHDIENAVDFYENILGLKPIEQTGTSAVFANDDGVYIGLHESAVAGTGQGTCAWWVVDDVESVVKELKLRGITFEVNYDLPHAKRSGDIYLLGKTKKAAWFKDLDGNILGVGNF